MTQDMTRATVIILMMLLGWFTPEASAMLNPSQGRFMQRDPLGYVDGMGVYEYVRSRPTAARDPIGLQTMQPGPITSKQIREQMQGVYNSLKALWENEDCIERRMAK